MINNFDKDFYNTARNEFINWATKISFIEPLEFGSVNSPGLSDLDLGLCFNEFSKDKIKLFKAHLRSFPKIVENAMNGGTLMLFRNKDLDRIALIDDINLNFLTRNEKKIISINKREAELIKIIQIIEWIPERMSRIHMDLYYGEVNKVRTVGYFYSLHYSILKSSEFVLLSTKCLEYKNVIDECRVAYVTGNNKLFNLRYEWLKLNYLEICNEIMIKISSHLQKQNMFLTFNNILNYKLNSSTFFQGTNSLNKLTKPLIKNSAITINIPNIFISTYYYYSMFDNSLGKEIKKRFINNSQKSEILKNEIICSEISTLLDKRIHLLNDMFKFMKDNDFKKGLYKFGWYL